MTVFNKMHMNPEGGSLPENSSKNPTIPYTTTLSSQLASTVPPATVSTRPPLPHSTFTSSSTGSCA